VIKPYPMTIFEKVITLLITCATALVPLYIALLNAMQKRKYDNFTQILKDQQESMSLIQKNYETLKEIVSAKDDLIAEQKQAIQEQKTLLDTLQGIEEEVLHLRRENQEMKETIDRLTTEKNMVQEQLNHYLKLKE